MQTRLVSLSFTNWGKILEACNIHRLLFSLLCNHVITKSLYLAKHENLIIMYCKHRLQLDCSYFNWIIYFYKLFIFFQQVKYRTCLQTWKKTMHSSKSFAQILSRYLAQQLIKTGYQSYQRYLKWSKKRATSMSRLRSKAIVNFVLAYHRMWHCNKQI